MAVRALGAEHAEEAFALATAVFVAGSAMHRALGLELAEYRAYLRDDFLGMVGEGLSVAAWEGRAMVGCLVVTDFHREGDGGGAVEGKAAPISALLDAMRAAYPRRFGAGDVALADMGAVLPEAGGRGVYRALRLAGEARAREAGFRWIVGELSSAATQHVVLERMGHRRVAEISYADFEHGGRRPFAGVEKPKGIVLAEGAL